jgi:sulfide:quinone oxidoreductase
LVLGCGVAGVVAARELRDLLPAGHRVVVVDREAEASHPPSYLWLMTGERRPEAIKRQRARLARKGIEFVKAEVRQIDPASRYVRAGSREFHYDYLVVALGAEAVPEAVPGLAESAHSIASLESAERLAATLRYFPGGRIVVVAAGADARDPLAPYEAAMLLEQYFHDRRIRQKVDLHLYTPEEQPFGVAGPQTSEALQGLLAHRGIELHVSAPLVAIDPHRRKAQFADESHVSFQLLIAATRQQAPAVVSEAGLAEDGAWAAVNPGTLETVERHVYAVGNVAALSVPDGGSLPRLGVFAQRQARQAARQIAYSAAGGPYPEPLDGRARQFIEVGGGAAAMLEGDFLAARREIVFRQPSVLWHWANLAQERYWLWRWY